MNETKKDQLITRVMSIMDVPCEIMGEPQQNQINWALSILALNKCPSSLEELHKLEIKLLAATHPDVNPENSAAAKSAFQRIGNACKILRAMLTRPSLSTTVNDNSRYYPNASDQIIQKFSLLTIIASYKARLVNLVDFSSYNSFKGLFVHPRADEIWNILNTRNLLAYAATCPYSIEFYATLSRDIRTLTEQLERENAQRNRELTEIFNVIKRIRAYLSNVDNQLYYPNLLTSAYHLSLDEYNKIDHYLHALRAFLNRFDSEVEVMKKIKFDRNLKPLKDYLELETNLKSAYFKLQYKELVITACDSLKNLIRDRNIWSSTIKFTSFSDFVDHCFADPNHQLEKTPWFKRLQPILDELVAEQPYSFVDLYLVIKCIRFAYQENVKKTDVINRFLTNYFNYFTHYVDSSLITFIESNGFFANGFLAKKEHFTAALQALIKDFCQQVDLSFFATKGFDPSAPDKRLELQLLKTKLSQVLHRYKTYLDKNPTSLYSVFFEFFSHRTTLSEATTIINKVLSLSNTQSIREQVLDCLTNQQLGGAGQNDFRTYLLEAFVGDFSPSSFSAEVVRLSNIWELSSPVEPAFVLDRGMN